MKRSNPPLHRLAAIAAATSSETAAATAMSYRPEHRGARGRGRRSYSGRGHQQVSGDSHFRSVENTNRGFRPPYRGGDSSNLRPQSQPQPPPPNRRPSYSAYPPPPNLYPNQPIYRPFPPPFYGQQFSRPQGRPPIGHNQQFRPPVQWPESRPRLQPPRALNFRVWENAKAEPPPRCDRFTVLSYNILADYLATNHQWKLYKHIPQHFLDWQWRKRSIIFELGLWSADIICLQEVDKFQDLEAELQLRGYRGIWKMRTGDAVDGCAIFWRDSRFKLRSEDSIEFRNHGLRDNVAQICVFELLDQHNGDCAASSTSSSNTNNKVVICNIHVLFNPRRGEMKLGQIRLLLDRADHYSKLWNGAPIVLCGDFNCTPESPLYNFLAEQKLDILEVPRDKVSGQYSAQLNSPKRSPPMNRAQSPVDSANDSLVAQEGEGSESSSKLNLRTGSVDIESGDGISRGTESETQNSVVNESSESSVDIHFKDRNIRVTVENFQDSHTDLSVAPSASKDIPIISHNEGSNSPTKDKGNSETSESSHGEFSTYNLDPKMHSDLKSTYNEEELSVGENHPRNETSSVIVTSPEDACSSDNVFDKTSEVADALLDKKMAILSLDKVFEGAEDQCLDEEDSETFLSELCGASDPLASDSTRLSDFEEIDTVSHSQELLPLEEEILDDERDADSLTVAGTSTYDPSAWTPVEIQTATGSADCTVMEHRLKLKSVYREVEDVTGTRGSTGEPEATSYNLCFLGTIDYIWRSEGLQTVRVLAPIPKKAMQFYRGFPTKKWGSDHIALVSELAFTKDSEDK